MTSRALIFLMTCLFLCAPALAQDCPPDAVGCHTADVDFEHRDALFDDVMFDTGWVPASSPLQVRFALFIGGSTQVNMGGTSVTSWPPPLDEAVNGRAETGRLAINYGLEIIARIRFDVRVAGIRYNWEGDIPIPGGIPADLRMADEVVFDPFLLPDAAPAMVMDETGAVEVVNYDITGSLIPIPGISGGFLLTATAGLEAAYVTDRILLADAVDAIEMERASVVVRADPDATSGFGAAKDLRITPEGTLTYDGTIRLTPSLYIEIAGRRFDMPLGDLPIPIGPFDSNTDFNTAEVHVPLPDIRVEPTSLDFEMTAVGDSGQLLLTVHNDGEAPLSVSVREPALPFVAGEPALTIPPSSSARLAIDFEPFTAGDRNAVLFLASNDPDEPLVTIQLNGSGFGMADAGVSADGGEGGGPPTDGGCSCRIGARSSAPFGWLALAGLALFGRAVFRRAGLSRARRRRP